DRYVLSWDQAESLKPPNAKRQFKLQSTRHARNSGRPQLAEIDETATVDRLLRDLGVEERLDAMIDKCLKRLLFLRGLKSLSTASSSAPPQPIPEPQRRIPGPTRAA